MVNNFTADQIGDSFVAKLIEPYDDIVGVNSWDIVAGVSTPNTIGTLSMTAGNTTVTGQHTNLSLIKGDSIIVGNIKYEVDNIYDPNTFTITTTPDFTATGLNFYLPLNPDNLFNYEFKWSQEPVDTDGGSMSEYALLNNGTGPSDLLGLTFDSTRAKKYFVTSLFAVISEASYSDNPSSFSNNSCISSGNLGIDCFISSIFSFETNNGSRSGSGKYR